MTTGRTIALTRWTLVGKMMSLLFNMVSRFVIAFISRSKLLWISWLQSTSTVILEPKKIKSKSLSSFLPSICCKMMGLDAVILIFWMLSFKAAFSLSFFTFVKRLFSSSSLSTAKEVSSAFLRLLVVCPEILILLVSQPIWHFAWLYSAYTLNKQGDKIQPWHTLFPILNLSLVT